MRGSATHISPNILCVSAVCWPHPACPVVEPLRPLCSGSEVLASPAGKQQGLAWTPTYPHPHQLPLLLALLVFSGPLDADYPPLTSPGPCIPSQLCSCHHLNASSSMKPSRISWAWVSPAASPRHCRAFPLRRRPSLMCSSGEETCCLLTAQSSSVRLGRGLLPLCSACVSQGPCGDKDRVVGQMGGMAQPSCRGFPREPLGQEPATRLGWKYQE